MRLSKKAQIEQKKAEITRSIIEEIGVDIDSNNTIIDQDTMMPITFNEKTLKVVSSPDEKLHKGETPFNPLDNRKLMSSLFDYHSKNQVEMGNSEPISIYYNLEPDAEGRSKLEAKDSSNQVFTTRPYFNDSLKMAELMFKIGGSDIDLTEIDEKIEPKKKK